MPHNQGVTGSSPVGTTKSTYDIFVGAFLWLLHVCIERMLTVVPVTQLIDSLKNMRNACCTNTAGIIRKILEDTALGAA